MASHGLKKDCKCRNYFREKQIFPFLKIFPTFVNLMDKRRSIGARLVGGYLYLRGLLPLSYHRWWGRVMGRLLGSVLHYRYNVVITNLSRCFPEKDYDEIKAIAKRFYTLFATVFTEMIWFGACRGDRGRKRLRESHIVEITNPEELNRMYACARQMVIMETHAGNWELIGGLRNYSYGQELDVTPDAFAVTYHPMHSAVWDSIMASNRTAPVADQGFDGYISTDRTLRFVLENRERRYAYTFITDQRPYTGYGSEITFMGQKAGTVSAAAHLAVKLDMSVVYLRYRCREEGGYTMTFVPICEHAAGQDPMEIMKKYYSLLEEDLREQPFNYLWTHKRWIKY